MLSPITSIARVDFTARESMRIIRAFAENFDELPFSRLLRRFFLRRILVSGFCQVRFLPRENENGQP
jgi:hypothetical protein